VIVASDRHRDYPHFTTKDEQVCVKLKSCRETSQFTLQKRTRTVFTSDN